MLAVESQSQTASSTARQPSLLPATVTRIGLWSLLVLTIRSHSTVSPTHSPLTNSFSDCWCSENYVYKTSGRTPALSGKTLFHAINNVWSTNSGHLLEGDKTTSAGLYEGNYFEDVPTVVVDGFAGQLFTSEASDVSQCSAYLGRDCVSNELSSSGEFSSSDTDFLSDFKGQSIPDADSASSIKTTVPAQAGNTL